MLKYLPVIFCMSWLGSLLGCARKPKVVTIDQLSFPVIRILDTTTESKDRSYAQVILDKEALSRIPVQELWYVNAPVVIDSNGKVLDMKDIKNEHGGLWMMINPSSQMPVKFTLVQRNEAGIEAARDLIAECRFLGGDLDGERTELRRDLIRKAVTIEEIIKIIHEDPPGSRRVKIDKPNKKG